MGNIISIDEVKRYLIRIKQSITKGNNRFEGREKNLRSLGKIGILPSHVKEVVLQLTCLDYFNGPEEERDTRFPPGEYMFFGCQVEGYDFFVNLRLKRLTMRIIVFVLHSTLLNTKYFMHLSSIV